MNQDILVEIKNDTGRFVPLVQSYNDKIPSKIIPYILFSYSEQSGIPSQGLLSIANPDANMCNGIFGRQFRISIGYSSVTNSKVQRKLMPVFVGQCVQSPVFYNESATDQILTIPLAYVGVFGDYVSMTTNNKIGEALAKLLPNAIIKYHPIALDKQFLKKPLALNGKINLSIIQKYFAENEGLLIKWVSNDNSYLVTKKDSGGLSVTSGVIPNNSLKTSLLTKYAVIDVSGVLNIELACVLPSLLGKVNATIENIGTNINVFNASSSKFSSTFFIMKQEITFSTWGDSTHSLGLLATL